MEFETQNNTAHILGFIFSYFLFTVIFFLIINYLFNHELHAMSAVIITSIITSTGLLLRRWLE